VTTTSNAASAARGRAQVRARQRRGDLAAEHGTQLDQHLGAEHDLMLGHQPAQPVADALARVLVAALQPADPEPGVDKNPHD
jgi:hypothetical protein